MQMPLVVSVIGISVPTLAQQKDTVDPKIVEQIRVLASKYDEAINRQDATGVAALYSQDGVWVTHDGAFHGRQAIEKGYVQLDFKSWQIASDRKMELCS
jgi:ketosteroid isomerase-like protein